LGLPGERGGQLRIGQYPEQFRGITFGPEVGLGLNGDFAEPGIKAFLGRAAAIDCGRPNGLDDPLAPLMRCPQIGNVQYSSGFTAGSANFYKLLCYRRFFEHCGPTF
jgi:hypothetical protein